MKPSLLTLFQRGRYYRLPPPTGEEAEELVRARKEAERFTAAAIGFCISHHAGFRRFFVKAICDVSLSPRARCEIEIEPQHWADLMVHFGRRKVAVVEFKLGAPLRSHQNPAVSEFWEKPIGYGALLGEAYPSHEKHFVILGTRRWLQFPKRDGWRFEQVVWADLARNFHSQFHRIPLLEDLRDCLAQFGVWEFASMKARELSVAYSGACGASAAWEILWTAYIAPDVKFSTAHSCVSVDADYTRQNQWYFGIEVQAAANASLAAITRPNSRGGVLWFGYECERRDEVWQSVWLYCESEQLADEIARKFRPGKHSAYRILRRTNEKGLRTNIGIRGRSGYGSSELDWFVGWLSSLSGWAQHRTMDTSMRRRR